MEKGPLWMARSGRMFVTLALAPVAVALAGTFTPTRAADAGAAAPAPAIPACVAVKTDSRYVPYGYNHVVTLTNGCAREARCLVSTDVNPEQRSVDVPSSQAVEVLTFMGSPSSTFTAKVTCKLR